MQGQVEVIDNTDELFGFVGEILWIGSGGEVMVYFNDVEATIRYNQKQLKYLEK